MPAQSSEFYRGRAKKKTRNALILSVIALSLVAFLILLFYGLQKFIVITNDGLYLDIPILSDGTRSISPDDETKTRIFEDVAAVLEIGEPDYDNIKVTAGEGLSAVKALYVPSGSVSEAGIAPYAASVGKGNMLMLDVKPQSGKLVWASETEIALGYGTAGETDLAALVASLHEQDIKVGVRLSCFADDILASRYAQLRLYKTNSSAYEDDNGSWLDPSSSIVRRYVSDLCRELDSYGVDEILLNFMRLPEVETEFAFQSSTSAAPTPETVISGFAINLARGLKSCSAVISVQINTDAALTGTDSKTGQNAELILKIYDRIYKSCDSESAAENVDTVAGLISLGEAKYRYVPIVSGADPGTECRMMTG